MPLIIVISAQWDISPEIQTKDTKEVKLVMIFVHYEALKVASTDLKVTKAY